MDMNKHTNKQTLFFALHYTILMTLLHVITERGGVRTGCHWIGLDRWLNRARWI